MNTDLLNWKNPLPLSVIKVELKTIVISEIFDGVTLQ